MDFLAVRERKKWNSKMKKKCVVREAKVVRMDQNHIIYFTSPKVLSTLKFELGAYSRKGAYSRAMGLSKRFVFYIRAYSNRCVFCML